MFAPRAFWIARRRAGFVSALGPPVFTAIAMSFEIRVKTFAIRFHRANIVALRVSKMRPIRSVLAEVRPRAGPGYRTVPARSPVLAARGGARGVGEGVGCAFRPGAPNWAPGADP